MKESSTFESGYSNRLEKYYCYDDPARDFWIDGSELIDNPDWGPNQRVKWKYFYRPVFSRVGYPQQQNITQLQKKIEDLKAVLRSNDKKFLINIFVGFIVFFGASRVETELPLLMILVLFLILPITIRYVYQTVKGKITIRKDKTRIAAFQNEIDSLRKQIPIQHDDKYIEQMLHDELVLLERKCLGEIVNKSNIDSEEIDKIIRHAKIDDSPTRGILIQGWGVLQPTHVSGPFGREATGLARVKREMQGNIVTFRVSSSGKLIFRVLYLQFVFLLEKNVNVYGFFYDFVTEKIYSRRSETFLYNHVSNFSIREIQLEEQSWLRGLGVPNLFISEFKDQDINAFSLSVSSSASFRCVLIDEHVIKCMNEWFENEKVLHALEADEEENDILAKLKREDPDLVEKWQSLEDSHKNDIAKRLIRRQAEIKENSLSSAWKAMQYIREQVEAKS